MTKFENFLKEKGFKPHSVVYTKKGIETTEINGIEAKSFSSIAEGRQFNRWVSGNTIIDFGLEVRGKSATIINPKPKIFRTIVRSGGKKELEVSSQNLINIAIRDNDLEEVYRSMFDKNFSITIKELHNDEYVNEGLFII